MLLHTLLFCMHHILQVASLWSEEPAITAVVCTVGTKMHAAVPQPNHVVYFPHLTTAPSE